MDLEKIRKMNDKELKGYLKRISERQNLNCVKCGERDANYTINIKSRKEKQQKKLCSICEDCYEKLLDYFETDDILWD